MFLSIAVIAVTWLTLRFASDMAYRVGLLDYPKYPRKQHQLPTPLVGGIAIYIGLVAAFLASMPSEKELYFLLSGLVLIVIGGLDDRFELGVWSRLLAQLIASLIMTLGADVRIESLGNLLGFGEITLGLWSVPFTVFATAGIVNAINMTDGIDGLAGSLTLVALAGLGMLCWLNGYELPLLLWLTSLAIIPYLVCNLELPGGRGKKVFLGDAGSMLLGFILVWLLIDLSQKPNTVLSPVTALWLVAIPLMDTLTVMARRAGCGLSLFNPDRRHLHHVLVRSICYSRLQALFIIVLMSALMAVFGIIGEELHAPEPAMFYAGIIVLAVYYRVFTRPRALLRWLRASDQKRNKLVPLKRSSS